MLNVITVSWKLFNMAYLKNINRYCNWYDFYFKDKMKMSKLENLQI